MPKYVVLSLNPTSQYDWEKLSIKDPLTGQCIKPTDLLAHAIDKPPGSYLITLKVEVEVHDAHSPDLEALEKAALEPLAA